MLEEERLRRERDQRLAEEKRQLAERRRKYAELVLDMHRPQAPAPVRQILIDENLA